MSDSSVSGGKELDKALAAFERESPTIARRVLRAGLRKVAAGIKKAVPRAKTRGHGRRSIQKAVGTSVARRGAISGKAGFGVGKTKKTLSGEAARKANAVIFGTQERTQASTGRRTGAIQRTDTVKRGWAASKSQALQAMNNTGRKEVQKAAQKARRRKR